MGTFQYLLILKKYPISSFLNTLKNSTPRKFLLNIFSFMLNIKKMYKYICMFIFYIIRHCIFWFISDQMHDRWKKNSEKRTLAFLGEIFTTYTHKKNWLKASLSRNPSQKTSSWFWLAYAGYFDYVSPFWFMPFWTRVIFLFTIFFNHSIFFLLHFLFTIFSIYSVFSNYALFY